MKRIFFHSSWITIFLITLIVTAYLVLPSYLPDVLKEALEENGYTDVKITLDKSSWSHSRFTLIQMSGEIQGRKFTIRAHNVAVEHDVRKLWEGKISGLEVQKLDFMIDTSGVMDSTMAAIQSRPASLLPSLPFSHVNIVSFTIDWQRTEEIREKIVGSLQLKNFIVYLEGSVSLSYPKVTLPKMSAGIKTNISFKVKPQELTLNFGFTEFNVTQKYFSAAPLAFDSFQGTIANGSKITLISQNGYRINGTLNVSASLAKAKSSLDAEIGILYDISSKIGMITFPSTSISFSSTSPISSYFSKWPYPFDLIGGKFEFKGDIRSEPAGITGAVDAKIINLSGKKEKITFTGLNSTKIKISKNNRKLKINPIKLTLDEFNPGFKLQNITGVIRTKNLQSPKKREINLSDIKLALLGGKATCEKVQLSAKALSGQVVTIAFNGLDLEKILALEQQQGLSGSGKISGSVPMQISTKGFSVAGGSAAAESGGIIQYQSTSAESVAKTNPALGIALGALRNFHYKVLDLGIDYSQTGDLVLKAALSGNNPDFQGGQTVNFNIKLEENIPTLLRSLMLTKELTETIGDRVKQKAK